MQGISCTWENRRQVGMTGERLQKELGCLSADDTRLSSFRMTFFME